MQIRYQISSNLVKYSDIVLLITKRRFFLFVSFLGAGPRERTPFFQSEPDVNLPRNQKFPCQKNEKRKKRRLVMNKTIAYLFTTTITQHHTRHTRRVGQSLTM